MHAYGGTSDRLLTLKLAVEMLKPQLLISGNPVADSLAVGFDRSGKGSVLDILHTGGTWGSTAIVWAYPETGQGAVIMTNSATVSRFRFEILLGIALEYGWPMIQ